MVAEKKSTAKKKVAVKKGGVAKKVPAKKAVAKKSAVKKSVSTKKVAIKKTAAASTAPMKASTAKQTKTQVITAISEMTGLNKKEVGSVFTAMSNMVSSHMKPRGSGEFTIPEVGVKIKRIKKPATKARKGVNPFTGEAIMIKAKPARNQVRLSALKALKDSVLK
jgi:nucleoid DNA-binding protein